MYNGAPWIQQYADKVAQQNKVEVRVEAVRDQNNRHWGKYRVVDVTTGLTISVFDWKSAKRFLA